MNENVVCVTPNTALTDAAMLLSEHGYNGLPVLDGKGKPVGMFSERNLVTDNNLVHLETLLKLLHNMKFYKKDNSPIKKELGEIMKLKVKEVMTSNPPTVLITASVEQVIAMFSNPINNPLCVVDEKGRLVGIVALSDLAKFYGFSTRHVSNEKNLDKKIETFMNKFDENFVVVTKYRVSTWFLVSILFTVVGFAIAMMLILRVDF